MEQRKDMVYGEVQAMIHILVSGRTAKLRVMVSMFGRMEIDMKESGFHV